MASNKELKRMTGFRCYDRLKALIDLRARVRICLDKLNHTDRTNLYELDQTIDELDEAVRADLRRGRK